MKKFRFAAILLISLIVALAFIRLLFPEADPSWLKATDDIHDETWWAENARQQILLQRWMGDEYAGAMAVAPLSTGLFFLFFKLFGISFFSLRLIGLLPAICGILILLFRRRIKPETSISAYLPALLLASSPLLFVWSRIGQLESLMGLILLIAALTGHRSGIWFAVLAGVIAATGVQVKSSFILLAIPLAIWSSQQNDTFTLKRFCGFMGGFLMLSLGFYFWYYLPNLNRFQPYYSAFTARSFPIQELLDPRGWPLRLAWFPKKDFLSDPVNLLSILFMLLRFGSNHIPVKRFSFSTLLLICFAFTLFSDFSDRRFIPFVFILPLALTEETQSGKISPLITLAASFILLLGTFPYCPQLHWFVCETASGFERDYRQLYPFLIISVALCIGLFGLRKTINPTLFFRMSLAIWTLIVCHSIGVRFSPLTGIPQTLIFSLMVLFCTMFGFQYFGWIRVQDATLKPIPLVITGIFFIATCLIRPSWNLREAAGFLAVHGKRGETSIGPPSSFSLTFLSNVTPHHYLDLELNPLNKQVDSTIRWYCAITTPPCNTSCIRSEQQDVSTFLGPFSMKWQKPVYPSFSGFRETAIIAEIGAKSRKE